MSPYPVATRPGSMPSSRWLGSRDGLEDLVGNVVVGVDGDDALALEHPGDGAGRAHVAAEFFERVADLRARPVPVVGEDVDHHGHAARGVSLVRDLLV